MQLSKRTLVIAMLPWVSILLGAWLLTFGLSGYRGSGENVFGLISRAGFVTGDRYRIASGSTLIILGILLRAWRQKIEDAKKWEITDLEEE